MKENCSQGLTLFLLFKRQAVRQKQEISRVIETINKLLPALPVPGKDRGSQGGHSFELRMQQKVFREHFADFLEEERTFSQAY